MRSFSCKLSRAATLQAYDYISLQNAPYALTDNQATNKKATWNQVAFFFR